MAAKLLERLRSARSGALVLTASAVAAPLIVLLCVLVASPGHFAPAPPPEVASAPVA